MAKKEDSNVVELAPDTSFLSNPTGDAEEDRITEQDAYYLGNIDPSRKSLAKAGRAILVNGKQQRGDHSDYLKFGLKGFRFSAPDDVSRQGTLDIKVTWRADYVNARTLKLYLDNLDAFVGSADEVCSHIAHDIFMMLRPQKISVKLKAAAFDMVLSASKELAHSIKAK